MIVAFGSRLIGFNGRIIDFDIPVTPWTFTFTGKSSTSFSLVFYFMFPSTMTVDWGDGNVTTHTPFDRGAANLPNRYQLNWSTTTDSSGNIIPASNSQPIYNYADGLNILRTVKVSFGNRSALYSIAETGLPVQSLNLAFAQFPALGNLTLGTAFNPLNISDIAALPNLAQVNLIYPGSTFPQEIFLTKLVQFQMTLNTSSFDQPFSTTNLDKLPNLKNTLKTLILANWLQNVDGTDPIPSNWSQLQLTALTINGQPSNVSTVYTARNITKFFSPLENMTSLSTLSMTGTITDWSNLGGLTGLTSLTITGYGINFLGRYVTSSGLPSFITATTLLKTISTKGVFRAHPTPQLAIDTLITNLYNFVSANASKTNNAALPLRSIRWDMSGSANYAAGGYPASSVVDADTTTVPPSGTFQQPTGYIAGSNNGSPASPMEMAWVLVNQYKWTLTFATLYTAALKSYITVTTAKASGSSLSILFNLNTPSFATSATVIYYGLTYVVGGVSTTVQLSVTMALGAQTVTANYTVSTGSITQVSVSINSIRQNPTSQTDTNPIYLMSQNPYITNF